MANIADIDKMLRNVAFIKVYNVVCLVKNGLQGKVYNIQLLTSMR